MQKELSESRPDAFDNIIIPQFKDDERLGIQIECNKPSKDIFYSVGYIRDVKDFNNEKQNDSGTLPQKHYRRFYSTELENAKDVSYSNLKVFESPFMKLQIYRNELKNKDKLLSGLFSSVLDELPIKREVGYFKCSINVYSQEDKDKFIMESKVYLNDMMRIVRKIYENETKQEFPYDQKQLE